MAIAIKNAPTLKGDEARAFNKRAEKSLTKRESVDFSKEFAEFKSILAKAKF